MRHSLISRLAVAVATLSVFAAACSSNSTTESGSGGSGAGTTAKPFTTRTVGEGKDFATIQAAVDAASPGDLVLISPGVYKEEVIVETEDLVIRGTDRNEVIIDGEFTRDNGIKIFSNGVAVENLTSRNHQGNGVFWTGDYDSDFVLDGYRASYLTVSNNGDYGVYAFNATRGQIDHIYGSGHPDSAVYVGQCNPCNAVVTDVLAENNFIGYSGTNSTGVSIVNSVWRHNQIGITPQSQEGEKLPPNDGGLIAGNNIYDNNNQVTPRYNDDLGIALGTGIVAAGVNNYTITKNRVVDNRKANIVVILWPFPPYYDPHDNKVTANTASGAETYGDIVLALADTSTGTLGNCFSGNSFSTARPANLEDIAPCEGTPGTGFEAIDASVFTTAVPPAADYKTIAAPGPQPTMPDAETAPPVPAGSGWQPMTVDVAAITTPTAN